MREWYRDINFRAKSLRMIDTVNNIIAGYQKQGLKLTLRQTYYQCIVRNLFPNSERSYKNLGNLISDARLAGLMDWDSIEDRVRKPRVPSEFSGVEQLIETASYWYRLPRWDGQENYVELWVEKDALAGVLSPIASEYHVTMMVNRGYCVSPETRVLTSDLRWVRADEVNTGDTLLGADEDVPGPRMHRKMRMTSVLSTTRFVSPRVRVKTDQGEIIVSTNHPFLATRYNNPKVNGYHWVNAEDLKVGSRIAFLANPWDADDTRDGGWLAGIYDGEGCLPRTNKSRVLAVYQNPGLVADKIERLLCARGWLDAKLDGRGSSVIDFRTYSAPSIVSLLGSLRPVRLLAEFQAQVRRGVWPAKGKTPAVVRSVERIANGPVVGIETSTGTLYTDGYVSHNSSQSAMYEAGKRYIENCRNGRYPHLIYLGDMDPSGEDMVRDISDRLEMYNVGELQVTKVALTMEQVESYKPPPNPAKMSDSRAAKYVDKHGTSSWEVDALPPAALSKIIREELSSLVDREMMDKIVAQEEVDKRAVREIARAYAEKQKPKEKS